MLYQIYCYILNATLSNVVLLTHCRFFNVWLNKKWAVTFTELFEPFRCWVHTPKMMSRQPASSWSHSVCITGLNECYNTICAIIYYNSDLFAIALLIIVLLIDKPVTTDNILDVLQKDAINRLSANGHGGLSTQHLHSGNDVSFLRSDDEIVTGTTEGSSNSTSELVRAEDNRMKSVTLCLGCHEREANVIFHPCEHKVLCRECWAPPYETNCPACDLAVNSFGDADWNWINFHEIMASLVSILAAILLLNRDSLFCALYTYACA